MPRVRQLICAACLAGLPGCADIFNHNWCAPPGPESYQLAVAKKFDPYPDPTIAPPIVGGRPLGFIDPRPEPDVTKNMRIWPVTNLGGAPAPYYGPAPPATTAPPFAAPAYTAPAYVGPAYTAPSFSAPQATYPPSGGYAAPAVVAPPLYAPAPASNAPPLVPLGP